MMRQNTVESEDVIAAILIVALIVIGGWLLIGVVGWIFGAMDKWYPLGLREKIGFIALWLLGGIGGASRAKNQ